MVLVLCISSDDALYNFIYMLYITLTVIQDFQYSNFQRGIIPYKFLLELCSAYGLMMLYICIKFHENI